MLRGSKGALSLPYVRQRRNNAGTARKVKHGHYWARHWYDATANNSWWNRKCFCFSFLLKKLAWLLQVKIKVNKVAQDKILLNNVTARANHSEMLAVVGPSGSSKTTFLDAMAGRIDRRSLSGQILVNQSPMDATFKRVSGYVMQVRA